MTIVYTLIAINTTLTVLGQYILKIGINKIGDFGQYSLFDFVVKIFTNLHVLGGLSIFGIAVVTWMALLSKVDLSFAYPTLALGYVLIFLISYFFLGESINIYRIIGMFLIIGGIIFIFKS